MCVFLEANFGRVADKTDTRGTRVFPPKILQIQTNRLHTCDVHIRKQLFFFLQQTEQDEITLVGSFGYFILCTWSSTTCFKLSTDGILCILYTYVNMCAYIHNNDVGSISIPVGPVPVIIGSTRLSYRHDRLACALLLWDTSNTRVCIPLLYPVFNDDDRRHSPALLETLLKAWCTIKKKNFFFNVIPTDTDYLDRTSVVFVCRECP